MRFAGAVLAGLAGLAAYSGLAACSGRSQVPVGSRIGPALAAAMASADESREPWRCAAPDGPSMADETVTVGGHTWQLGARVMKLGGSSTSSGGGTTTTSGSSTTTTSDGGGAIAIGVIADAAGSAPETLAALGRLRAKLAHVDLVISLGGMGATRAELDATIAAITDRAEWPLVALPGDLEPVPAQSAAIAAARQRGTAVIDGRLVQRIELSSATIALVPGAGAASRLVAGTDGCIHRTADVAAAFADLTPRPGLRILASTEAPRLSEGDEPAGELAMTAGAGQQIDIALHGPTSGAATPARSGRRDGAAVPLTPGSSDATPRLPGPRRSSTAGILTLQGSAWTWTPIVDIQ